MNELRLKLQEKFRESVISVHADHGDETVEIRKDALLAVASFIRDDADWQMNVLMDLTAVDGLTLGWKPRFRVVYHFYSTEKNHRLRIKVPVETDGEAESLTDLWPIADWFERECWDMFGIKFRGHPNLKRILLYEEFKGHPLRKDYPIHKRQPLIGPKN